MGHYKDKPHLGKKLPLHLTHRDSRSRALGLMSKASNTSGSCCSLVELQRHQAQPGRMQLARPRTSFLGCARTARSALYCCGAARR